jgi:hypothetical protein
MTDGAATIAAAPAAADVINFRREISDVGRFAFMGVLLRALLDDDSAVEV